MGRRRERQSEDCNPFRKARPLFRGSCCLAPADDRRQTKHICARTWPPDCRFAISSPEVPHISASITIAWRLVKIDGWGPFPRISGLVVLRWGSRLCLSSKFPGAAESRATFWEPLSYPRGPTLGGLIIPYFLAFASFFLRSVNSRGNHALKKLKVIWTLKEEWSPLY